MRIERRAVRAGGAVPDSAKSSITSVATISAPSSSMRLTMVASSSGTKPSRMCEPPQMGIPATATLSFTPMRLPLSLPEARAFDADFTHHRIERIFLAGRTPARVALAIAAAPMDSGSMGMLIDAIEKRDDGWQHRTDSISLGITQLKLFFFAIRFRSSFFGSSIAMIIT